MIVVPNLPSSIINREIDEIKHRHVPLTYRRFAPPFKKPTDTSLLEALVLASTGHSNRIPDVVDTKNQSIFAQTINDFQGAHPQQTDINRSEVIPPINTAQTHEEAEEERDDTDMPGTPPGSPSKPSRARGTRGGARSRARVEKVPLTRDESITDVADFDFGRRRRSTSDARRRSTARERYQDHQTAVLNTLNNSHIPQTRNIDKRAVGIKIEQLNHILRDSRNEERRVDEHLIKLNVRESTSKIKPSEVTDHEKEKKKQEEHKSGLDKVQAAIEEEIKEMRKTIKEAHPPSKLEKKSPKKSYPGLSAKLKSALGKVQRRRRSKGEL
jgi:hypothetical protein